MITLSIAFNYIRRHLTKFLLITLACGMLISSITIIIINGNITKYNNFIKAYQSYPNFVRIYYDCDESKLTDSVLNEYYCGRQDITGTVDIYGKTVGVSWMDTAALASVNVELLRGRLPESKDEIAVTENILNQLNAKIGDTVTLSYTSSDGVTDREFVICALITDITDILKTTVISAHTTPYWDKGEIEQKDIPVIYPEILTAKQDTAICRNAVQNIAAKVFLNEESMLCDLGEKIQVVNYLMSETSSIYNESNDNGNIIISYILIGLIVCAVFGGIYGCVRIISDGQKNNLALLKTIGASKGQRFGVFLWESGFISLISALISIPAGAAFVRIFNTAVTSKNTLFHFPIPYTMIIISAAVSFAVMMVFFIFHFRSVNSQKQFRPKSVENEERVSLEKLWTRTVGRHTDTSKWVYSAVICAFTVVFTVGMCFGDTESLPYLAHAEETENDVGYFMYTGSGGISPEYFDYGTPSYNGFTDEEIAELNEKYNTSVYFKGMEMNINSYIISNGKTPNGLDDISPAKYSDKALKLINAAGLQDFEALYKYRVKAVPYEYLKSITGDSDITQEDFDSGRRVISVNGKFDEGEKLALGFMFFPDDYFVSDSYTQEFVPGVCFADITVTDNVTVNEDELSKIIGRFADRSFLLVSDKYLLGLSDRFRYDFLALNGDKNIPVQTMRDIDTQLSYFTNSKFLFFENYIITPVLMQDRVESIKLPIAAVSALYMIIVVMFGFIFINSEIKSRSKSIALLRSMGISSKQLTKTVITDACTKVLTGVIVGIVLSVALSIALILLTAKYNPTYLELFPYTVLMIYPLIPTFITLVINIAAALFALHRIKKEEIYRAIVSEIF